MDQRVLRDRLQTGFLGIIAFALLLFLLVQAKFLLISLAIAIIIFSLTSSAIAAIARQGIPNWLATTIALALITAGLLWASTVMVAQVNYVILTTIGYAEQIQTTLPSLTEWMSPEARDSVIAAVRSIDMVGWARQLAAQASNLLSGAVLVILFVGFMFAERAWFPVKVERLAGDPASARQIREIINSVMNRVNRYLVYKTFASAISAAPVWVIFKLAGLDLAGPVTTLTFVLNFVPNIGSVIATVVAILLAWVQTGDNSVTLMVGLACTTVQFASGNIIETMLMGQALRLSSFGIVLGLAFWGAVWGVAGMFLAVPIMVATMIVCAEVSWLRPVAIMLSREGLPDDEPSPRH